MKAHKGFTLIELLIVVAIIAILAAIAVPNFLEAQTRAKVSRAYNDLRTLATAIEAYTVDHNKPPVDGYDTGAKIQGFPYWYVPGGISPSTGLCGVTSPIAYITNSVIPDSFRSTENGAASRATDATGDPPVAYYPDDQYRSYRFLNCKYTWQDQLGGAFVPAGDAYIQVYGAWRLSSSGPDRTYGPTPTVTWTGSPYPAGISLSLVYDSSNGTISSGDLVRSQKHSKQPGPYGSI